MRTLLNINLTYLVSSMIHIRFGYKRSSGRRILHGATGNLLSFRLIPHLLLRDGLDG